MIKLNIYHFNTKRVYNRIHRKSKHKCLRAKPAKQKQQNHKVDIPSQTKRFNHQEFRLKGKL